MLAVTRAVAHASERNAVRRCHRDGHDATLVSCSGIECANVRKRLMNVGGHSAANRRTADARNVPDAGWMVNGGLPLWKLGGKLKSRTTPTI